MSDIDTKKKESQTLKLPVVGIVGKKGVGKTTIADMIEEHAGPTSKVFTLPWAHNLKEAIKIIFGLDHDDVHDPKKKEEINEYWGLSPRQILQKVGTDCMRNHFDADIWVKSAERTIVREEADMVLIPDCRFPNEVKTIEKWCGVTVLVKRSTETKNTKTDTHASETALDGYTDEDYDFVIVNDGSLEELRKNVVELLPTIRSVLRNKKNL